MVANCALIGSLVSHGGLPIGRFHSYRSSSSSLLLSSWDGGEEEGSTAGHLGLCGGPPPELLAVGSGGESGSEGRLEGGTAGHRGLRVKRTGVSRMGL